MSSEEERLHEFLSEIQLEQFFYLIVKNLHVTRLAHFDHVEEIDLTGIGMSKPEQRRLFDHLKKAKRPSLKKFFRRSFRKDSDRRNSNSPPKDIGSSFDSACPSAANDPIVIARNNIQQGLKCLIQQKDIVLGDFLGKGAFGYVKKGIWTTEKGLQLNVAVKCLKPNQDEATVMLQGEFIKEANAMSKLDHPNLIRLYGIVLTTPMMLVTELAPVGSLLNRLRKEPKNFMISILCSFVVQIVSGMKYLEQNRSIHRDLAARNILLVSYEKIKIGDFGLMRALPSDADYYVMQPNGLVPFAWCATECLKYRRFSHASDVWAFGVTILEIFSYGQEPWPGLNGAEILEKIDAPSFLRPGRPDHCPVEIYKIMKHHCWNHNPEERSGFEVLEKKILEVLPKEINATCDYYSEHPGELSFKKGDPLTIIESCHDPSLVKAQNRRNGKVGYIPVHLLASSGFKSPETKRCNQSLSGSKRGKRFHSDRGKLLEPDSFSVASRSSSSSSGSNSSSECQTHHSMNISHSKPQDIPFKRQSTLSSGIGSSGPSCTSSYKEDVVLPGVVQSDYGSHDDSVSLASRKSTVSRGITEVSSLSAYENTALDNRSITAYENFSPREQLESPVRHSRPIAIPQAGYEIPHVLTLSKDPNIPGSPHLHIVSLPCHNAEADANLSALNVSSDSDVDGVLSSSAPTTKRELKAVQITQQEQQVDTADEFVPRASFGSYKKKPTITDPVYQYVDNVIYESMVAGQNYEVMEETVILRKKPDVREAYENIEYARDHNLRSENVPYENVYIESYERGTLTNELTPLPPLPPRTHSLSEKEAPVPARTYRSLGKATSAVDDHEERSKLYDNSTVATNPRTTFDSDKSLKLPPRTYKTHSTSYGNTEINRKTSSSSKSSYENYELSCSPDDCSFAFDSSYENRCISTTPDRSYEKCEIRETNDSPPPLPKKRLSRSDNERSFSPSDALPRGTCENAREHKILDCKGEQVIVDAVKEQPHEAVESPLERNCKSEPCDPKKQNLIDDSPVHVKLTPKYGTIWNGQEITDHDDNKKDAKRNENCEGAPIDVPCEELLPLPIKTITDHNTLREASHEPGLLRALLSPVGRRSPRFNRAQSEECPIPPPRKHRDRSKSTRRHTVGTLSAKEPSLCNDVDSEHDLEADFVVKEDPRRAASEEKSWSRSCDGVSDARKPLKDTSRDHNDGDPEILSLPPRNASDLVLMREDSDFVDIEIGDVLNVDEKECTSKAPCEDDSNQSVDGLFDVKCQCISQLEEKARVANEKREQSKGENVKTRFSRIKSLLSGKISNASDTGPQSADVKRNAADEKEKEAGIQLEANDDNDDDETRYVLHFVTPV